MIDERTTHGKLITLTMVVAVMFGIGVAGAMAGAPTNAAIVSLILALVVALGYRRVAGADGDADATGRPTESTEGPPLESWRSAFSTS